MCNGVEVSRIMGDELQPGWERKTFIVRKDFIQEIHALAKRRKKSVKDTMDEILTGFFKERAEKSAKKSRKRYGGFVANMHIEINSLDYLLFKSVVVEQKGVLINDVIRRLLGEWVQERER